MLQLGQLLLVAPLRGSPSRAVVPIEGKQSRGGGGRGGLVAGMEDKGGGPHLTNIDTLLTNTDTPYNRMTYTIYNISPTVLSSKT